MKKLFTFGWVVFMGLSALPSYAQFTIDGQLIQRAEYRHGYNVPIVENQDAGKFIAQRFRLQALYEKKDLFTLYMSVQDVRTWGSTSQAKVTDAFLSVHEAWGSTKLGANTELKLGRQELNYDGGRFLGALDWALQGRAHDIALLAFEKDATKLHLGLAYNMNDISNTKVPYTVSNQYKAAQLFRLESQADKYTFAFLVWNDGRQRLNSSGGTVTSTEMQYRTTFGIPTLRYADGNSQLSAYFYQQLGKDQFGRDVNAYNVSLSFQRRVDINAESGKAVTFVGGVELLSGSEERDSNKNTSFSPQYGTNHAHNGYMDLFFVNNAQEFSTGLLDLYGKVRYAPSKKWFMQGDAHVFSSQRSHYRSTPGAGLSALDKYYGTEIDLSLGVIVNEAVSFQAGYSQFLASDTFKRVRTNNLAKDTQNWAYMMLIIRPNMKNKFIGISL